LQNGEQTTRNVIRAETVSGEKQNKLAEIFSVNKSTISRLIKKFQKEENIENNSNRGHRQFSRHTDDFHLK
jgi:transposase